MRNRLPFSAFLLFAGSLHLIVPAVGQAAGADVSNIKSPTYEVVSVRPSKSVDGMQISLEPNGLSAGSTTLFRLIFNAYHIRPSDDIPGLPAWAKTAEFDVEAKMDDDLAAALKKLSSEEAQKKRALMLRALLADRFKLRVHYETRERPIYSLLIAKGGPKLKEATGVDDGGGSWWGRGNIKIQRGPIESLAFCLSDVLGREVKDNTGLHGRYDVQLNWTPDERQGEGEAGPTIFTALREQLGLKLVPAKGPVEVLVVDHAEKPSEN